MQEKDNEISKLRAVILEKDHRIQEMEASVIVGARPITGINRSEITTSVTDPLTVNNLNFTPLLAEDEEENLNQLAIYLSLIAILLLIISR